VIQHLVPLHFFPSTHRPFGVLIRYKAADYSPPAISIQPQSYVGSNIVSPFVVGPPILCVKPQGTRVRALGYSQQADGMVSQDLSLHAAHLLEGDTIIDLCYSASTIPMLRAVTEKWQMLGLYP
jgi:hypothetical protein